MAPPNYTRWLQQNLDQPNRFEQGRCQDNIRAEKTTSTPPVAVECHTATAWRKGCWGQDTGEYWMSLKVVFQNKQLLSLSPWYFFLNHCVALVFLLLLFLSFFFKPSMCALNKLEYAIWNFITSLVLTTVLIFFLPSDALMRHLLSAGSNVSGWPFLGTGFVLPSSENKQMGKSDDYRFAYWHLGLCFKLVHFVRNTRAPSDWFLNGLKTNRRIAAYTFIWKRMLAYL